MFVLENTHLYNMHEMQHAALAPLRTWAQWTKYWVNMPGNPIACTEFGRTMFATCELTERVTRRYTKPKFAFTPFEANGERIVVKEKIAKKNPFCFLKHFRHTTKKNLPKLLIVAPLSGHYATLLRGTVFSMLPYYDVYITDWIDAREVPLVHGSFDFDDYVNYLIEFLEFLGPNTHVMAVCQPSVPVMAAVSIMSAENNPAVPATMTLIGGPIDTRVNPTQVNQLAEDKPLSWFEKNVVTRVPYIYPGAMRRVYPGFMQLTGFMTMNLERHVEAHANLFKHLIEGDEDSAEAHRKFYNEYLSVMDLPAEFYLQTIDLAFKQHALPNGTMVSRGRQVKPETITRTALLTIEGERDDISGVGQTEAAHRLCANLPTHMKKHHLQMGAGHYGIFNGSRYRAEIAPMIREFIAAHARS